MHPSTVMIESQEEVMARIRFILEELFRSFWGSWLKDILLIAMFCISLVMAVLMCSYYFDLGERQPDQVEYGNSVWYHFGVSFAEDSSQEDYTSSLKTAGGCQNMIDFYGAMCNSKEHPILTICPHEILIREEEIEGLFGGRDVAGFLQDGLEEPYPIYDGKNANTCLVRSFKAYAANLGAYRNLELKTVEGEGFTEGNLVMEHAGDGIPILVGYGYKGILPIGQIIEVIGSHGTYRCRVAGVLEKGAQFPESDFSGVETVSLDSYILFPTGARLKNKGESMETMQELAWACIQALASGRGIIRAGEEAELSRAVDEIREIGEAHGLPPIKIFGVSLGLNLFRKESAARIRVMMVFTLVLSGFTFYSLFAAFYDKVQSNSRIYGIYLMNGCPAGVLLAPCLLEIALILLPAVLASRYVFTLDGVGGSGTGVILGTAYGLAGGAFLVGAGFLLYLMRGVDLEHLIRQKE